MNSCIKLEHVKKTFRDTLKPSHVLDDISLTIHEGEFFILLGASGSGKSTLLRIMAGLETYEGTYTKNFDHHDCSFVFQQFGLLPWLTVFENVELALIARGIPAHLRRKKVGEELELLGLGASKHIYPRDLSGGMRQRVGIARALVTNPKIIFMDEPFSELDSYIARELRLDLLDIWQKRGITVVMVTHIIPDAVELGSRIGIMSSRPGTIKKVIENTIPRPRNARTPEFYTLEDQLNELLRP